MAGGGIYDHVAGGFHRYSTDEQWLVPHFEKMLYDNALLAVAYLEAWQATGNADFQRVVYEILAYTGRDMTSPEGAFYSATDADSKNSSGHMEEGWYFTWTPEELETILGKERADIVEKYYAAGGAPNFEGRYIFHTPKNRKEIAALIDLYEADHDIGWLKKALALDDILKKFYEDPKNGGFYTTATDHEALIAREKPCYDGAAPSGNAVAALNLLRLHSYTTDDQFRIRAENLFKAFYQRLTDTPSALSEMLLAVDYYFDTPLEIILITPPGNPDAAEPFVDKFRDKFIPNRLLVAADEKQAAANSKIIPLAAGKKSAHGRTTDYVCENGTCSLPAETPEEFISRLRS